MALEKSQSQLSDATGNPLLGARQTAITAASTSHALNATFSDTEAETALNNLGTAINSIISVLEAHGLVTEN